MAAALTERGLGYAVVRPRPGSPGDPPFDGPLGTFTVGQAADLADALRRGAPTWPPGAAHRAGTGASEPRLGPAPVVLVDDAELLAGTDVEDVLLSYLRDAEHGAAGALVVAGLTADLATQYRGLAAAARRHRCGVLLSPSSPADADLLGARVAVLERPRPGRGLLVTPEGAEPVQVAVPDAEVREPSAAPAGTDTCGVPHDAVMSLPTPAAMSLPTPAAMSLPTPAASPRADQCLGRPA